MTDYLSVIEVVAIHEDQISRCGGAFGVRITAPADDAFRFIDGLYAERAFVFGRLVPWLKANTRE